MPREFAFDDVSQLHKDAQKMLADELAPDEKVQVIIRGNWNQAIIGTSRRAFVYKRGLMAGSTFGHKTASWDYSNINGVVIETGWLSGFVAIQVPGAELADRNFWDMGKKDPSKLPNTIPIDGQHFKQARAGVAVLRQLISQKQSGTELPPIHNASVADEITKFAELKGKGILTDEEFAAKKQQLLGL